MLPGASVFRDGWVLRLAQYMKASTTTPAATKANLSSRRYLFDKDRLFFISFP